MDKEKAQKKSVYGGEFVVRDGKLYITFCDNLDNGIDVQKAGQSAVIALSSLVDILMPVFFVAGQVASILPVIKDDLKNLSEAFSDHV